MDPTIAAAGISTAFQVAQNQVNKHWQERMYNQYQSPAAMVRQYQEAGLNPALMYGQNLQAPFNAPSQQNMIDPVGAAVAAEQIKVLQSQARKNNAEAQGSEIENAFKPEMFSLDLKNGYLNYENTLAGIHKIDAEIKELDSRAKLNLVQASLSSENIRLVLAQATKAQIEAANEALKRDGIVANNRLIAAQVVAAELQPAIAAAEIALMSAQSYSATSSGDESVARKQSIELENVRREFENAFRSATGFEPTQPIWNTLTTLIGQSSLVPQLIKASATPSRKIQIRNRVLMNSDKLTFPKNGR